MFDFPKPKIAYINKLAFELVSAVEKNVIETNENIEVTTGSLTIKPPLNLGKVLGFSYQKRNYLGKLLSYNSNCFWK